MAAQIVIEGTINDWDVEKDIFDQLMDKIGNRRPKTSNQDMFAIANISTNVEKQSGRLFWAESVADQPEEFRSRMKHFAGQIYKRCREYVSNYSILIMCVAFKKTTAPIKKERCKMYRYENLEDMWDILGEFYSLLEQNHIWQYVHHQGKPLKFKAKIIQHEEEESSHEQLSDADSDDAAEIESDDEDSFINDVEEDSFIDDSDDVVDQSDSEYHPGDSDDDLPDVFGKRAINSKSSRRPRLDSE